MSTPTTQQPAALRDELLGRATELVPVLRARAARTEQLRQIPPETVKDLVSSGLIRIGNPRRYGGHGVEIDTAVADGAQSLIREQVEMGVAVRMAVLEAMSRPLPNACGPRPAQRRSRMMVTERRPILLANGRILDPSRDLDIHGDLLLADGVIREAKRGIGAAGLSCY